MRRVPLRLVEIVGKLVLGATVHRRHLALNALTEEKLGGRVDGESEEDGLDIGVGGPTGSTVNRQGHHGLLNMVFFQIQLTDLVASKLRPQ